MERFGGIGIFVKAVTVISPNVPTFQLVIGGVRFYVMGAYIPPADTTGVDDLRAAWDKCLANCHPLLLGDLNINFGSPRSEREETVGELSNGRAAGAFGMCAEHVKAWLSDMQ